MKKHKLIVLSADALVHDDMAELCEMPNFKKYLSGGSACALSQDGLTATVTYCGLLRISPPSSLVNFSANICRLLYKNLNIDEGQPQRLPNSIRD